MFQVSSRSSRLSTQTLKHNFYLHETRHTVPVALINKDAVQLIVFLTHAPMQVFLFGLTDLLHDPRRQVLPNAQGDRRYRAPEQVREVLKARHRDKLKVRIVDTRKFRVPQRHRRLVFLDHGMAQSTFRRKRIALPIAPLGVGFFISRRSRLAKHTRECQAIVQQICPN